MRVYRLAVILSGASAVLGLLRELLIFHRLGLGASNDALQFALSVTYTVALLGEPLRMASLNLVGQRLGRRAASGLALLIGVAAIGTTLAYMGGGPDLPRRWIAAACLAGAANLVVAWVIPRSLRQGPFLPVHAFTVVPNVVIVAGMLVPAATDTAFAGRVVALFLVAPLVQLAGFRLLGRTEPQQATLEASGPDLAGAIGWHGVGAAGGMATQFVIRSALTAAPAGSLSAFTLMLRITETLRAVFVDSWVASRIQRWTAEGAAGAVTLGARLLPWTAAVAVAGAALAVALAWPGRPGTLLDPAAVVVLLGLYPLVVYRIGWQALNTSGRPRQATAVMAGLETAIAGLAMAGAATASIPVAVLPWLAYVVRPIAGVRVVAASGSSAAGG